MKNKFCIVKTTFESKKEAKKLAQLLVKQKLAACAKIVAGEAVYIWEGKVCQSKEYEVSLKTLVSNYKKIEKLIYANHSYKLPQIIQIPIWDGLGDYLSWIESSSTK